MYKRTIDNRWSFKDADTKEFTHCYHAYPAMMIPHCLLYTAMVKIINVITIDGIVVSIIYRIWENKGVCVTEEALSLIHIFPRPNRPRMINISILYFEMRKTSFPRKRSIRILPLFRRS